MKDVAALTPDTQAALKRLFDYSRKTLGLVPTVTSTLRTCAEQNNLYAQGRTASGGIVTNARGCMSWHVLARAADILLPEGKAADYEALGLFWESMGGYWGGRIEGLGDLGHFEWHPGYRVEQMCPNPNNCDGAVDASWALNIQAPNGGGGIGRDGWVIAGVALSMVGAFFIHQRIQKLIENRVERRERH